MMNECLVSLRNGRSIASACLFALSLFACSDNSARNNPADPSVSGLTCGGYGYNPETEFCDNGVIRGQTNSWNQQSSSSSGSGNTFTDTRDGKTYRWVRIGNQVWMAENLNFGTMVNGLDNQEDATSTSAQKYCYDNSESNCATDGGLYQWHTAMAFAQSYDNQYTSTGMIQTPHRGICPEGWHIPTREELTTLQEFVDSDNGGSSSDEGWSLKSTTGWSGAAGNGADIYGFSARPAGRRDDVGYFQNRGGYGYWWSASEVGHAGAWYRNLYGGHSYLYEGTSSRPYGFSVRCVKDDPSFSASSSSEWQPSQSAVPGTSWGQLSSSSSLMISSSVALTSSSKQQISSSSTAHSSSSSAESGTFVDSRDGKTYKWVKIGTQTWMAENLNFGTRVNGVNDQGDATSASAQKYCYGNNESNCTTYGGLYQWHTATALSRSCDNTSCSTTSQHRGICPAGWHLPSKSEWATLNNYVDNNNGGSTTDAGRSLKSKNLWSSNTGTDAFGWTGLPGGYRRDTGGGFYTLGANGEWWSSAPAWHYTMCTGQTSCENTIYGHSDSNTYGFSVRCVKD